MMIKRQLELAKKLYVCALPGLINSHKLSMQTKDFLFTKKTIPSRYFRGKDGKTPDQMVPHSDEYHCYEEEQMRKMLDRAALPGGVTGLRLQGKKTAPPAQIQDSAMVTVYMLLSKNGIFRFSLIIVRKSRFF